MHLLGELAETERVDRSRSAASSARTARPDAVDAEPTPSSRRMRDQSVKPATWVSAGSESSADVVAERVSAATAPPAHRPPTIAAAMTSTGTRTEISTSRSRIPSMPPSSTGHLLRGEYAYAK